MLCHINVTALDVVFRYDDFLLKDDSLQNKMIEIFAEEQVPLHVAVIPYYADTMPILYEGEAVRRIKELQQQGILQIALHGFCHKGETVKGEFLSLSKDEQFFRLKQGSQLLDSVFGEHIHIFIPPWNRYNQTTLDVLADLGFYIISSELTDNQITSDNRFQYYPEGIDHPNKLPSLISRNANREGLVVCMFHRYDFSDTYTMSDLQKLVEKIKANPKLKIRTMDEIFESDQSFNEFRIKANLHHPLLTKIFDTRPIILPTTDVHRLRLLDLLLHILGVLFVICIGAWKLKIKSYVYWSLQTVVLIFAITQTWYQFLMPKIGAIVIIVLPLIVLTIFYFIRNLKH